MVSLDFTVGRHCKARHLMKFTTGLIISKVTHTDQSLDQPCPHLPTSPVSYEVLPGTCRLCCHFYSTIVQSAPKKRRRQICRYKERTVKCIAVNGIPSHSYGVSLAIWDHTCHPTQVSTPALTPDNTYLIGPAGNTDTVEELAHLQT